MTVAKKKVAKPRCVVGNCMQPDEGVTRCYWNIRSVVMQDIEDRAYLDLCFFHYDTFKSRTVYTHIEGWDRISD